MTAIDSTETDRLRNCSIRPTYTPGGMPAERWPQRIRVHASRIHPPCAHLRGIRLFRAAFAVSIDRRHPVAMVTAQSASPPADVLSR